MSIDLRTVIGHKLSPREVIEFPSLLSENLELKQFFFDKENRQTKNENYIIL